MKLYHQYKYIFKTSWTDYVNKKLSNYCFQHL